MMDLGHADLVHSVVSGASPTEARSLVHPDEIPGDVTVLFHGIKGRRTLPRHRDGLVLFLEFSLEFGTSVAAGLVAAWIYDKFRGTAENLRLDGHAVKIDPVALKLTLESKNKRGSNKTPHISEGRGRPSEAAPR